MTQHLSTQNSSPAAQELQILPTDTSMALKALIKTTESLVDFSERESQALAKNDMLSFAVMQDEKTIITERYVKLAREFRERLEEFRAADPGLLDRLEKLQMQLGENARHNNNIIDQIQSKARKKTQSALFTAQELGQTHKVQMAAETQAALNELKERA